MVCLQLWFLFVFSRLSVGSEPERDGRDRPYREERRSVGEYRRPSPEAYTGDTDSYYSFAEKPLARASQYGGRESTDHVGYSQSKNGPVEQ